MKKIMVFFCFLLFTFLFINHGLPFVIINNETDKVIYLYSGVGEIGIEPNEEDASASMSPVQVEKGSSVKIPLRFFDLFMKNGRLYLGWKIGSRTSSQATAVRYKSFDITSEKGGCAVQVAIKGSKDLVWYASKKSCFKKLYVTSESKK